MLTGVNPLLDAQNKNDFNLARELFFGNPALAMQGDKEGKAPLHYAAHFGKTEFLTIYLEHNFIKEKEAFNLPDKFGITPLHYAASGGNFECIRILKEAGADFHVTEKTGKKPLQYSLLPDKTNTVRPYLRWHTFPSLFFLAAQKLDQLRRYEEIPSEVRLCAQRLLAQEEDRKEKVEKHKVHLERLKKRDGY